MKEITYEGVLTFYSETGTEGGHWAMQDKEFMGIINESTQNTYRCVWCGRIWDKLRDQEEPAPMFTYYVADAEHHRGHYKGFDSPQDDLPTSATPDDFNDQHIRIDNETSRVCYEKDHEKWELLNPDGVWSYEGLHILRNGDYLTVRYPDDYDVVEVRGAVAWEGDIKLEQQGLFTTDVQGLWVHTLPEGTETSTFTHEQWLHMFLREWPCTLETEAPEPAPDLKLGERKRR